MRIFLVDDQPFVVKMMKDFLLRHGHEVIGFTDPYDALQAVSEEVDLIISDVNMPGMDGFELASMVSGALGTLPPRTLLFSGENYGDKLEATPFSEVLGMFAKPFSLRGVLRVIEVLAQSKERCPGLLGIFPACPGYNGGSEAGLLCESSDYCTCKYYEEECGRRLRCWIAETCRLDMLIT